uniref:Ankyrin n=2 Tax=Cupriavidus TaxID=106589 RepID=Q46Q19_CUPPJ
MCTRQPVRTRLCGAFPDARSACIAAFRVWLEFVLCAHHTNGNDTGPKRKEPQMNRVLQSVSLLGLTMLGVLCLQSAPVLADDDVSLNARLLASARAGDEAGVRGALEQGAAVDSRNRIGDTALITASKRGLTGMARTLVDHGANVSQPNLQGVTPLMAAAFGGYPDISTMLLARHADLNATDRIGKTAMVYAAGQGQAAIVKQLLDAGVDVNARYQHGLTALMWAAGYDKGDVVQLLLSRSADASLRDDRGLTARQIAEQAGAKAVAAMMAARQ